MARLRLTRTRSVMGASLVDSFGLALGWTVFSLYAVAHQGLGAVGLYGSAMLLGVALSAPATAWLSSRLHGRALLTSTALVEMALRVGVFALLLAGAPAVVVAVGVTVMNVVAWTGYAGMRAEVAAVDARATVMTWYAVTIAGIEAVGTASAAVLPVDAHDAVGGWVLVAVIVVYAAALIPTLLTARGALVRRCARRVGSRPRLRVPAPLAAGFGVMLVSSGPTLLSVGLAAELYGRSGVALAAVAFTVGSLLAPLTSARVERSRFPTPATWAVLGVGVVAGWIVAPWHLAGLVLAQLLSGACLTAFEGTMDARMASESDDGRVTAGLASSSAARALGSAAAVAVTPALIGAGSVSYLAVGGVAVLCLGAGVALVAARRRAAGGAVVLELVEAEPAALRPAA